MGLDITAYRQLKFIDAKPYDADRIDDFYAAGREVVHISIVQQGYRQRLDGTKLGWHESKADSDVFKFCAGSYGGYNIWRKQLCRMALDTTPERVWKKPRPGPFVELIDFADNEGTIGAKVSAKLAKDFADWQDRASAYSKSFIDGEWFLRKYADWRKAFEMATDGGCVDFH